VDNARREVRDFVNLALSIVSMIKHLELDGRVIVKYPPLFSHGLNSKCEIFDET
jgi:hypothetical protein